MEMKRTCLPIYCLRWPLITLRYLPTLAIALVSLVTGVQTNNRHQYSRRNSYHRGQKGEVTEL
ncbi:hypothetical protein BDV29DRAFT_176898 [Aspergillus leporis]|uniref:Uncharacterized protein n=1 Tax=Aspergillus leporis TaxID=41062 RepID=A0A5N5WZQ8_9EURO|nr:hypothetical protein BDV29DRAFT_176898 [Aspergillus leporis]